MYRAVFYGNTEADSYNASNRGSFNIEVTSMTRLAYTVFEEQGFNEYKAMDDLGKTLIMRKVMEQCKDKLTIYKSKTSMRIC